MTPQASTKPRRRKPPCAHTDARVTDSRPSSLPFIKGVEHRIVRRRRHCLECDHKWTTYEVPIETIDEIVRLLTMLRRTKIALVRVFGAYEASEKKSNEALSRGE